MKLISIKMSNLTVLLAMFGYVSILMTSCKSDKNSPGFEYMPDMYRSPSYETYLTTDVGGDVATAMLPVEGTVPRNNIGFQYEYVPADMTSSFASYKLMDSITNPIKSSDESIARGKDQYAKMCSHCHGKTGEADGLVVTNGGFPPPPSFSSGNSSRGGKLKDLSQGKIFHAITYGVNMMGAHASQVSPEDRWNIAIFIKKEFQK